MAWYDEHHRFFGEWTDHDGLCYGNPARADEVRKYLNGLVKQKLKDGETTDRALPFLFDELKETHEWCDKDPKEFSRLHREYFKVTTIVGFVLWLRIGELLKITYLLTHVIDILEWKL